jgi:hypothetical protein
LSDVSVHQNGTTREERHHVGRVKIDICQPF